MDTSSLDWDRLGVFHARAVPQILGGKRIGDTSYLHVDLLAEQDPEVLELVETARGVAGRSKADFNVVRISRMRPEIALLNYAKFFEDPFPSLKSSWLIDAASGKATHTDFSNRDNPPILHRKELLLPDDHPRRNEFEALTRALEDYGAFEQPSHLIGFRRHWSEILEGLGLTVDGHTVVVASGQSTGAEVARHRTAIARSRLSTPLQALVRWGFLDGTPRLLDYGCGRGDDVRLLRRSGIEATGWDPFFAPDEPLEPADVVNLGFVLNVIEEPKERAEALRRAFGLARRVLAVAIMLTGQGAGAAHRDGVITKRATFQKYFSSSEFRDYVSAVLKRDPVPVAPGIVFVFKDDQEEQAFLARKQLSSPLSRERIDLLVPPAPREKPVLRAMSIKRAERPPKPSVYEANSELLDSFWARCLWLGRMPVEDEFDLIKIREACGSVPRALAALPFPEKEESLVAATEHRKNDTIVYLALNLFDRRRSLGALPVPVQRDIKAFFGSHKAALERARATLFGAGSAEALSTAAESGVAKELGSLAPDGDYTFHRTTLLDQPALIRVIVGCAERLEPVPEETDLIKIHPRSGRVSYLCFENFAREPLPGLVRRIGVDLRHQRVWDQSEENATARRLLFGKSRFVTPDFGRYDAQARFDRRLLELGGYKVDGLGVTRQELSQRLSATGYTLKGYRFLKVR